MARGPEGKIQDAVLRYAKSRGLLYKKNEVGRFFVSSGWPDVVFYPAHGQAFFMEFKRPGGKLTPLQEHMHKTIHGNNYRVYVVFDAQEGRDIILDETRRDFET